ncbi:uncharacterized protein ACA1_149790 [Acanthamoeba castellanii str. Neff]|uniref:Uncharacterized protein n=1 Tax=Acanthamoeba castellanii (strain ATCC 30010 / Neff) TaxID=1257118 RepID=L8HEF4_ACACF|nr:uncharacterized protein ACA1_149790 [Acanthamoeba castellanii str. Neff]ELR22791.1 hypothetical protein ACA1_149790 [Acanthamoeba castellanii str. Neff]
MNKTSLRPIYLRPNWSSHVFYQLVLTAYTSSTKVQSVLNYTPLCATPLYACFHLNFSYHINGASVQLHESETNIIPSDIMSWISAAWTVYLNFFSTFTLLLHLNLHGISS